MKKRPPQKKRKLRSTDRNPANRFPDARAALVRNILKPNPFPTGWPHASPADSKQIGGSHYKAVNTDQEHWNLVVAYGWDYYTSQATRYMFRWRNKNQKDDLLKAQHYLTKMIELVDNGWLPEWHPWVSGDPSKAYINQG